METIDKLYLELSDISKQRTQRESVAITEAARIMATTKDESFSEESRLEQVHDRAKIIFRKLRREIGAGVDVEPSIDYEQNYKNIVEIEKFHRLTIGEQNTKIEQQDKINNALALENKMLWNALKEAQGSAKE